MRKKILTFIIIFSTITPLSSAGYEELWGIKTGELINRLRIADFTTFQPGDNPAYNNKIIDFFCTINPEAKRTITILRSSGKPETDYCFFNERLYSISEEWNSIGITKALELINTVKEKYPLINTEKKSAETIYNFKKNKTKVYLYHKAVNTESVSIRIYYYSTDLFGVLLNE
jgi:hypothetical protein